MKPKHYLFLVFLCITHAQFGMEENQSIQVDQFEHAYNTFKKALETKINLPLLKEPIQYFTDIQKKITFWNNLEEIIPKYQSPLLFLLGTIKLYAQSSSFYESLSEHVMADCDLSSTINECNQLRNTYYELLKLLCSQAPFLCSSKWDSTTETPLLCAASSTVPMTKEIELLLYYNANPDQSVNNPQSYKNPLEAATTLGHAAIVDLLIQYNKSDVKDTEDPIKRSNFAIDGWSKKKIKKTHKKLRKTVEFNDSKSFKKIVDKPYIDSNYQYHDERHGYRSLLAILLDNYFVCRQLFVVAMHQPSQELSTVKEKVDNEYGVAQDMLLYFLHKKPECNVPYVYNESNAIIYSSEYQTPLKEAIRHNSRPLIIELIKAGANPLYKNDDNDRSALEYAHEQNLEIEKLIKGLVEQKTEQSSLVESE